MPKKYLWFFPVTVLVIAADQLSKIWVRANIEMWRGKIEVISGFFDLVYYVNTGAAFGVMQDEANAMLMFAVFTVFALTLMAGFLKFLPADQGFAAAMMGLITGGAVGNAIDRVMYQGVTDFLRFYTDNADVAVWMRQNLGSAEWPSFNIADSAIVVGVIVFVLQQLFFQDRGQEEADVDELDDVDVEMAVE
ncbi:MAG: signal peptidase II [Proteobacteria bacterium]|nr:signal peptidase II [Pseudomonadota bacterium]MCP4916275.1 signal peptidase II [Pseudomonadota bacterium]